MLHENKFEPAQFFNLMIPVVFDNAVFRPEVDVNGAEFKVTKTRPYRGSDDVKFMKAKVNTGEVLFSAF